MAEARRRAADRGPVSPEADGHRDEWQQECGREDGDQGGMGEDRVETFAAGWTKRICHPEQQRESADEQCRHRNAAALEQP